jgi:tRNA 2-thiocytidine biosynthesis protein TtcA
MGKKWKNEAEQQAIFLVRKVRRAVREFNMIQDGDKILVGVSGGKDSMSLLRLLMRWQRHSPQKYEIIAAHVKGDARGSDIEVPEAFLRWLSEQEIPFEVWDIILPPDEPLPMTCERCGRNRRRTLFEIAEACGCNKVALGHHLEDFAHTALLNLFEAGRLETMAFRRDYFGGKFSVIRPLAYIREHELARFSRVCDFPVWNSDCPMAPHSHREAARKLMLNIMHDFRSATINIVRAASRSYTTGEENK